MEPNKNQKIIEDAAVNWYFRESSNLFEFDGEAGTGKSFVLNRIKDRLGLKTEEILPMAFTGQAAIVMRTKGFENAITCHSGLFDFVPEYVLDTVGRPIMNEKFNVPLVRKKLVPRDLKSLGIKLLIIDEAWTVPKSFKRVIDNTGIKVIAAGDSGQLPPIGDEPAYLTGYNIFHLTELMRQCANSPIVYLAHRARRGLPIEPGNYGNVWVIYEDQLTNEMIERSNVVVCNKNRTRDFINTKVRHDILGVDTDIPVYGERMICRKNNWNMVNQGIALANGLIGAVVKPPKIDTYTGKTYRMDFLPDLLSVPFLDLDCDYAYLNADYETKQELKNDQYSEGEKFEYAYASTCHLIQGSEYNCGTYIEEFLNSKIQNNLNYTAITRFRNQMIYVKKRPKFYF